MIAAGYCVEEMMAESVGHPVFMIGQLFETQPEFHLDMFLMRGFKNDIFIQDHFLCIRILSTILKECQLTYDERQRLEIYIRHARNKHDEEWKRYQQIENQLKKAKLHVISIPGNFYQDSTEKPRYRKAAVALLNGIPMRGKTGNFCITNGSAHPADRFVRDVFTSYLQFHNIPRVYFAGQTRSLVQRGKVVTDHSAADQELDNFGGIHCLTQDIPSSENLEMNTAKVVEIQNFQDATVKPFEETLGSFFNEMLWRRKEAGIYPLPA
jgi:hypothetical protein